ncbi:MAG TPA: alanine--glyoxylate aminotransferase family protein [Deinococcales bacterium]|nr:alanine--glyoxylate aminotransferase family protein [Deinococcales bacterium]
MSYRPRLLTPGPVETSSAVQAALAAPQLHHRSGEAREVFLRARRLLHQAYCLPNEGWEVLIVTASGTGAMEAALASLLPPGSPVATLSAGKFGERWTGMCRALGHEVVTGSFPWGQAIPPRAAAELLHANPDCRALVLTHSETSTGVLHDLEGIARSAREARPDLLLVVDAVTSLAVSELRPHEWGLDAVVAGSQKGAGSPPGLGFAALSPRALATMAGRPAGPRPYYLDLSRELKAQARGESAFTPAINLVAALAAGLEPVVARGMEQRWRELRLMSDAVAAAGLAIACRLYPERPSPACVTLVPPAPLSGREVVRALAARGARVQGGQDDIKDLIVRISLMGHFDRYDALAVAGLLEDALRDLGAAVPAGSGVGAAWRVLAGG